MASKAMYHKIEIQGRDTIPYSYDWSQEIFKVHVPIDSYTQYLAPVSQNILSPWPCLSSKFLCRNTIISFKIISMNIC